MKIMAWNINGVKTKLEKECVHDLIRNYDVVSLYEVKTSLNVSFPGYVTFSSVKRAASHRGGDSGIDKELFGEFCCKCGYRG